MKRTLALAGILILILCAFAACKKNTITDYEGHEHTLVMKNGDYAQDQYGNLIEKIKDDDGNTVTQPVSFPNVIQNGNREIENAYFKLKIPKGWKFDDTIRAFRIQHDGACTTGGAVCEITADANPNGDVQDVYDTKVATENGILVIGGNHVSDVKKFDATLFGKKCKAFSSRHNDEITLYTYVFEHGYAAVSISVMINDACMADDFDPESFIEEIFTLKPLG